jgi:hypothetical protein
LFPDLERFRPDDAGLIALGKVLGDDLGTGNSQIPAGFTYLGQFVDHDITFDATAGIPEGALEPEEIGQGRTPALELDSLYGRGPADSPELYEADGVHLRLGTTTGRPDFGVTDSFPNDLHRRLESDPGDPQRALIGDPRNDENLIVAQTHVAFLKFHNKVVDRLAATGVGAAELFEESRKTVVQHYPSIVLHDLVRRVTEQGVFDDVLAHGRRYYFPGGAPARTDLCMPVEFSVAAYRLGHSMVRNAYEWNKVFSTTGRFMPDLTLFFLFSRGSGDLSGEPTLPSDWIVDWRRMYDFSEQPGGNRHPQLNFTRRIDTNLSNGLQRLPEFAAETEELQFLAVRNLLRGRLVGLPTGQDVAAKLGATALTPAEFASGPHAAEVLGPGFDQKTPLWFYILKEAEVQQGGLRLGEVGSQLVVETFHGLIAGSEHSILNEAGWTPTLPAQHADRFTMNDLLLFVNDLNPIGD